jgi:hypothetical protein
MQSFAEELKLELKQIRSNRFKIIYKEIHPILSNSKIEGACQLLINSYFQNLDPKNRFVLSSTEKFAAMSIINKKWLPF